MDETQKPQNPQRDNSESRKHFGAVQYYDEARADRSLSGGVIERSPAHSTYLNYNRVYDESILSRNRRLDLCDEYYRNHPLVKSAIDMFISLVCSGITIHYPGSSKEDRYRHWWRKVDGEGVSHRFVAGLFRHSFSSVKVDYAVLDKGDLWDLDHSDANLTGTELLDYQRSPKGGRNRIPTRFKILPPKSIERVNGSLDLLTGIDRYGIRMPQFTNSNVGAESSVLLSRWLKNSGELLEIGDENLQIYHYQKDDWREFGDPLITSILKDLLLMDAMKASDMAALQGAISKVRLWTLGRIEEGVNAEADDFQALIAQLVAMKAGNTMDLVWDDLLKMQESSSDGAVWLKPEKYTIVLQMIMAGLGLPQGMGGGEAGGLTNNALHLKTVLERLQPARQLLIKFWDRQFAVLKRAFPKDRHKAELHFDDMGMSDEAFEMKIWMDMHDRRIISTQTFLERMGELPNVELARHKKETRLRSKGNLPARQGPFNGNAAHPDEFVKIAANQGIIAPSEYGVEKKPKEKGDESFLDIQAEKTKKLRPPAPVSSESPKGVAGQGRPKGARDSSQRKQRTPVVRQAVAEFATLQAKARRDLKAIEKNLTPIFLDDVCRKNLRSLNTAQAENFEEVKWATLMAVPSDRSYDPSLDSPTSLLPFRESFDALRNAAYTDAGVNPSMDELREMQVMVYALHHGGTL